MTKESISRKIILYDIIGFGVVILALWLDELIDIPHLVFGAYGTPVNITESAIETVMVLILGIGVITFTWRLLGRIKYLEGFLPVCSFCKKIRLGDRWVPIVDYISMHSAAQFSHGCCPECAEQYYGDILKNKIRMSA
jgi:hypothetical protein